MLGPLRGNSGGAAVVLFPVKQTSINQALKYPLPFCVFEHLLHAPTLAITVVVVAVPKNDVITVVLSSNMRKCLRQRSVRKLVGIEASGNLNILFADKPMTRPGG